MFIVGIEEIFVGSSISVILELFSRVNRRVPEMEGRYVLESQLGSFK